MAGQLFLWPSWTSSRAQSGTLSHFGIQFFAPKGLVLAVQFRISFPGSLSPIAALLEVGSYWLGETTP